ncbi:MAG: aminodeoxychorismate/anthranilate synthase component II [Chitinophagaceae bacterium]|nr:MAG: aminodeoxychorismate/anthranilate synthase component II [Chitinophagaceae bacterium]
MILVFDNYDSFTYNLVHLVRTLTGEAVEVHRNDELPLAEVARFDRIILSPGPGIPEEAGLLLPLIREYADKKPILGVCLGHQAIGQAFGGTLSNLDTVFHGVATPALIVSREPSASGSSLFAGLPDAIEVGRYHSWVVDEKGLPEELEVTARDDQGLIMAMQHRRFDIQGVQFHPESVLTPDGAQIIKNWLGK